MSGEEVKVLPSLRNIKTYARSASWTERSPTKFDSRPKFNSKARGSLPPLQPLSINKPSYKDWPTPGSDDLGVWVSSPMPAVKGFLTPREGLGPEPAQRDAELPRDELAFFNKECSKIVEYIFLGSDTVAKNRDVLLQNGVTHVLNCVGFSCPEYFKDDFVYKTLWLQDSASEDITSVLYDVFDYFEDVRQQGGRVFVHCRQGVSRSSSLVIAYLMWKEEQSFEDAFQHVKAARRVANPNMGFASQLLQCQKRVQALPPTPSSVLRMYRMAPHSPHDPLHLVPKLLDEAGMEGLDSRGAFIIQIPLAIYVWIGKHCVSMLSENAEAAAFQVIRYEKAPGPALIIKEGEEPSEFWGVLGIDTVRIEHSAVGQRQVKSYNIDFDIFHKAVSDGTRLPAMETGWSRLRRKFSGGHMKDAIALAKLCSEVMGDSYEETQSSSSPVESSSYDSQDSNLSYATIRSGLIKQPVPLEPIIPSYSRPASSYASPSLSPSNSESSSSFTFSPSSSTGSDLSYLSAQPSPSGSYTKDLYYSKIGSLEDSISLLHIEKTSQFLPSVDEESENSSVLVRSYSFSLGQEDKLMLEADLEKLIMNDVDEEMLNSDIVCYNRSDTSHTSSIELPRRVEEDANVVVYQWPSMGKVDKPYDDLDSGSIYIIYISEKNTDNVATSYVWVGCKASWEGSQNLSTDCIGQEVQMWMNTVGRPVLSERGLATDCHIQIIKEDEEPEQLLKYLSGFSFQKS